MRVLHINVDDTSIPGLYQMVCRIIRKKAEDIELDVASFIPYEDEAHISKLEKLGASVHEIGAGNRRIIGMRQCRKNLYALLVEEQYDIVHIHSDNALEMRNFAAAAKKAGVRKIILHSHKADCSVGTPVFNKILHRVVNRSLVMYGTEFVASSDAAAKWMFPNIDLEDVFIVREGVSTASYHFDPDVRERVRDELDLNEKTILIGNVSDFEIGSNHEFMMDVLAELLTKKTDIVMLLLGNGSKLKEVKQDAAAYGLSKNIIFMKNGKRNELMQAMDAFIYPGKSKDLPVAVIQAQTAGLPTFLAEGVSEEAKIIDTVEYLPVKKESEIEWAERIRKRRVTPKKRTQGAARVKRAGFGIARTIKSYLALYQLDEEDEGENE